MPASAPGNGEGRSVGVRAFVFTDVEDPTVTWEREPAAIGRAMARMVALTDEVAGAHGGTRAVEQGAGDRAVLVFASPSDATSVANPQEQARAHFWIGLLDRRDGEHHRAEGHLHAALELHDRHGHRQMVAGTLEAIAALEHDHGRWAVAVRLLGAAAAVRAESGVTHRLGWQDEYFTDLQRARRSLDEGDLAERWQRGVELRLPDAVELARRGRGERGRPMFGWDSLTATERRVASLLAEGRTNPEIAQTLLMGRETVKTHVSSILRKLGVANRTQVAAACSRRDESTEP